MTILANAGLCHDTLPKFQNIDFMPTILSRFDMIFIVKDEHDIAKDTVGRQLPCHTPSAAAESLPSPAAAGQACDAGAPECGAGGGGGGGGAGPHHAEEVHCLL